MAGQPNGKILIQENFFNVIGYNANYISTRVARLNPTVPWTPTLPSASRPMGGIIPMAAIASCVCPTARPSSAEFSANTTPAAWSLVRIFAGPANFTPGRDTRR